MYRLQQDTDSQPPANHVVNDIYTIISRKEEMRRNTRRHNQGNTSQTYHCDGLVHVYQLIPLKLDCDTVHIRAIASVFKNK